MPTDKKTKTNAGEKEKITSKLSDSAGKSNDGLTNKLQSGSKKTDGKG